MTGGEAPPDSDLRAAVITGCRALISLGLTYGTSGNVSVRRDAVSLFVSPTGMAYEALEPDDVPLVTLDGRWFGRRRPSSEWRFHRDIMAARPQVGAIVHAHSRHATALACTGRGIPAFHYMVAVAGGEDIRCAPYHTFGTQELSDAALTALEGRKACLLAHHGIIALGGDLGAALKLAGEVESLAAQYCVALALGNVGRLDAAEMHRVAEKFRTSYGRQDVPEPALSAAGETLPPRPD
ncbi:MAG TPA: class II aldolase/adducin family protein [Solirubrobacteraceae bacterium]|nr:class II aldolase/adducin family protein [Solirubrobacteraceae bacterium]